MGPSNFYDKFPVPRTPTLPDASQRAAQLELLLRARPLVAPDGPEPTGQIGSLPAQAFADGIERLSGQLHDVEEIKDDASVGKVGLHDFEQGSPVGEE